MRIPDYFSTSNLGEEIAVQLLARSRPLAVAAGALAGMVGAAALGLVAPLLGGTPRLISAPCAPAAAVLRVRLIIWNANPPAGSARRATHIRSARRPGRRRPRL